jgi:hypothetical protein
MAAFWQAKVSGTYTDMKTPSSYRVDWEDLDKDSYRSINTGNLIDTVVSKSWTKASFDYNLLTMAELNTLLAVLDDNPIEVKIPNANFASSGTTAMSMRCSKKSVEMLEGQKGYRLSFNLVQKTKIEGQ